jgi:cytochrome b
MTNGQIKPTSQTLTKWILDLAIFIGFLIAMEPRSTGIAIHEWFTLAALATILVHLLINWDWIVQVTKRFLGRTSGRARINYVLNWLLFIDGTLLMLSGILISEVAMPALGFNLPAGFSWRELHDTSANISLVLLGLHTALHWSWIVNAFKSYILKPIRGLFTKPGRKEQEGVA